MDGINFSSQLKRSGVPNGKVLLKGCLVDLLVFFVQKCFLKNKNKNKRKTKSKEKQNQKQKTKTK